MSTPIVADKKPAVLEVELCHLYLRSIGILPVPN